MPSETLPQSSPLPEFWGRNGLPAALVAALLGAIGLLAGWRGGDLAAQVFRADMFRDFGFALWDNRWYGGHPTLDYSLIAPAVGSVVDPRILGALAGVLAAWLFAVIVWRVWGPRSWLGALWFAVGTATNLAVGRVTFALGFAVGLAAVAAIQRGWFIAGAVAAVATSLVSPVAGLFVALAAAAWFITDREHRLAAAGTTAAALLPILLSAALFPGTGSFPYGAGAIARDLLVCAGFFALMPRELRVLRVAAVLYGATCLASFLIATPLGANVSRLGQCVAGPILACVLWPNRKKLLAFVAVPLLLWQWLPAVDGIVHGNADIAAHREYYAPLLGFLAAQPDSIGRVEVPPLYHHWESVYVGERHALARGWERQLDIGYHELFYEGRLRADEYQRWLSDNAVEFVALGDGKLDKHSVEERKLLLEDRLPQLREVFRSKHWRVWRNDFYRGFVTGPAQLVERRVDGFTIDVTGPGTITVRERYSPRWKLDGQGCVAEAPGGWTDLRGLPVGRVRVTQSLQASAC